jgi:ribosome biogenesis GTPase
VGLNDWGWDDRWASVAGELAGVVEGSPARVSSQERTLWTIETDEGLRRARVPARFPDGRPAVGDWVLAVSGRSASDPWRVTAILPRRSKFSRKVAGEREAEQIVAANIDRAWILHGLDLPPNPRRLERYVAVAWESGAVPEIVLTKADLATDLPGTEAAIRAVTGTVALWVTSTRTPDGTAALEASLVPGETVALLGPSGVGKSTLVNRLAGASLLAEGEVREGDRKGRHTTTRRQIVRLDRGALLLDTPGMRELQLWESQGGVETTFSEIDALAAECRFRDCRHNAEPGCAVLTAIAEGRLERERLESYRKLEAEASHRRRKTDPRAAAEADAAVRSITKAHRSHPKYER